MVSSFNRRTFLIGAAAAVGAAACGSKGQSAGGGDNPVITVGNPADAKNQLNLLVTSGQFLSGVDQRIGLVMKGQQDFVTFSSPVTLAIGPDTAHLGQPFPATIHTDAGTAPAYLTASYRFPAPATYWLRATYQGKSADAPVTVIDPSQSQIPIPGQAMISTPTPTTDNHRGVEPICTRQPACPWHDISLDVALGQHRPMVLLFATPALCQTATCGPVLDQLLSIKDQFESSVRFLHSEIYTDHTATTNTPAVLAYHLDSEPIMFLAGPDGTVKERIDGLYGHGEIVAAVSRLIAA